MLRLRKYLPAVLLGTIIFWGIVLVVWHARRTVISDEKHDSFSGVTYGYRIQQYYFWRSSSLNLWLDRGLYRQMDMSIYLSRFTIEKVEEQRWLSNGSAIYLNLKVRHHSSIQSVNSLKMIYDFHRGEMYTSSRFTMFRFWNEKHSHEAWLSEPEFDAILARYAGE